MSDQMPWDRFQPEEPEEELPYVPPPDPEEPPPDPTEEYVPPPPKPIPVTPTDWDAVADQLWPMLREQLTDYLKDSWGAIREGKTVDLTHPTITGEDHTGKELVIADAKSRSWRTLVQGLFVDVLFAITAVIAVLSGLDPFVRETWIVVGILLLKSVGSAVVSYFMRLKVTPTIRVPGQKMAVMPIPRPMVEDKDGA